VLSVEDWAEIRRLHRAERMPIKQIARVMGCSKNTVKRALAADGPPQYARGPRGSIVDAVEPRILHLYGLMDGTHDVQAGDPEVVICVDEFGPLNLQPHPGRQWTSQAGGGPTPRRRRRATYTRPHGVRHLLAAYDLSRDRLYGHIKPRKRRGEFLVFLRYLRTLYPPRVRIGIVLDNFSPHLSTNDDPRISNWAAANNVELAYTPTNASWLNRIEAQFTALRYFTLDGTDHASHREQASMIRRYLAWRNRHARDQRLGRIIKRANVA
jgi:transposase